MVAIFPRRGHSGYPSRKQYPVDRFILVAQTGKGFNEMPDQLRQQFPVKPSPNNNMLDNPARSDQIKQMGITLFPNLPVEHEDLYVRCIKRRSAFLHAPLESFRPFR